MDVKNILGDLEKLEGYLGEEQFEAKVLVSNIRWKLESIIEDEGINKEDVEDSENELKFISDDDITLKNIDGDIGYKEGNESNVIQEDTIIELSREINITEEVDTGTPGEASSIRMTEEVSLDRGEYEGTREVVIGEEEEVTYGGGKREESTEIKRESLWEKIKNMF